MLPLSVEPSTKKDHLARPYDYFSKNFTIEKLEKEGLFF